MLGEWLDLTLRVFFNLNYSMFLFLNSFLYITQSPPAFFCGFRDQIFLSSARKCCHQLVKLHYRHICARSKIQWIYRYTATLDYSPLFKSNTSQSHENNIYNLNVLLLHSFGFFHLIPFSGDIKYYLSTFALLDFPFLWVSQGGTVFVSALSYYALHNSNKCSSASFFPVLSVFLALCC